MLARTGLFRAAAQVSHRRLAAPRTALAAAAPLRLLHAAAPLRNEHDDFAPVSKAVSEADILDQIEEVRVPARSPRPASAPSSASRSQTPLSLSQARCGTCCRCRR